MNQNYWLLREAAWQRYEALLREAERDRLLRANGLERGMDALVRERLLRWAVALHRRLHELEATGELNHGAEVAQ